MEEGNSFDDFKNWIKKFIRIFKMTDISKEKEIFNGIKNKENSIEKSDIETTIKYLSKRAGYGDNDIDNNTDINNEPLFTKQGSEAQKSKAKILIASFIVLDKKYKKKEFYNELRNVEHEKKEDFFKWLRKKVDHDGEEIILDEKEDKIYSDSLFYLIRSIINKKPEDANDKSKPQKDLVNPANKCYLALKLKGSIVKDIKVGDKLAYEKMDYLIKEADSFCFKATNIEDEINNDFLDETNKNMDSDRNIIVFFDPTDGSRDKIKNFYDLLAFLSKKDYTVSSKRSVKTIQGLKDKGFVKKGENL